MNGAMNHPRFVRETLPPIDEFNGRVRWREALPPPQPQLQQRKRRIIIPQFHPVWVDGGRVRRSGVHGPTWDEYTETYEQGFRVADDSLDVYELYSGEGQAPDFDASGQPVATSATLPFTWAPPSGTVTLHLVVRKRNKYGLRSFNVWEKIIEFVGGVAQPANVSAPMDVKIYDGATGYIRIVAKYLKTDDSSPATHFDVYVKIGSAPVIGVDPVTTTKTMVFFGDEAGLAVTAGPYTPGTVAYVLVSARRSSDSERGNAAVVTHTLAQALDLSDGFLFGGNVYEQR